MSYRTASFVGVVALLWTVPCGTTAAADLGIAPQMVLFGGSRDEDACSGTAHVSTLEGGRLNVRAAPDLAAPVVDRLSAGTLVIRCDERNSWIGIVYGPDNSGCGTGTPVENRKAYDGPCKSGWVSARYLKPYAG